MSSTEPATAGDTTTETLNAGMSISLTVNDLAASRRFYAGLGFEEEDAHEVDGEVRFVQLTAGDAQIGLGQDDFARGRDRTKGVGFRIWLPTAQNVYELAERAKAAGITLAGEPHELPWGGHAFEVVDPDGFNLSVANPG